jgi:hypothetical protein
MNGAGPAYTFNPTARGTPTPIVVNATNSMSNGLACPSAAQCIAVEGSGEETFNPTRPGTPVAVPIDASGSLQAVACPSALQCTAVDDRGHEITFNPLEPGTASAMTIPGANALDAIACRSVTTCVAVDNRGNAFIGTTSATGVPPGSAGLPGILGTPRQGATLSEPHGSWTNGPTAYSYLWQDCDSQGNHCIPIFAAASQSYTLQPSDVGHTIRVEETATSNSGSSSPVLSAATSVVWNVIVGRITVRGSLARVPITCESSPTSSCTLKLALEAIEASKHGKVVVALADKRRSAHALTRKPVTLGTLTTKLSGGRSKTVSISLNGGGRRLLSHLHALRLTLTITASGEVFFRHRLTFSSSTCAVPKLLGKTLESATRALKIAHCKLGRVTGPRHGRSTPHIKSQKPNPGTQLPAGSAVAVKLG